MIWVLPKGSSDAIGNRLYPARALSSAVEHTPYMGEVARSIRAAPTITFPGYAAAFASG